MGFFTTGKKNLENQLIHKACYCHNTSALQKILISWFYYGSQKNLLQKLKNFSLGFLPEITIRETFGFQKSSKYVRVEEDWI